MVPVKVSIGEARRIGYFMPEFPSQMQAFFWHQYQGLRARGLDPVLVSTRKPAQGIISPAWANDAMLQTQYPGSPDLSVATGAIRRLASVHLRAWGGCLASI